MGKKNRVVATITIHVTENGTYKVGETKGDLRRHRHDLTWTQVKHAIKEFRTATSQQLVRDTDKPENGAHVEMLKKILRISFPEQLRLAQVVRLPCGQTLQCTHHSPMTQAVPCGCAQSPQKG